MTDRLFVNFTVHARREAHPLDVQVCVVEMFDGVGGLGPEPSGRSLERLKDQVALRCIQVAKTKGMNR